MKKLVSMCLVLLIAITASMSTLAITGCNKAPEKETGAITNGSFEISEFRGNGISLMSVTPMTVAENSTYAEQTLKATVMPESATNKEVDWSVAWADGQEGTVTDYVTVTASANGSTTASVKCYQAFTGNIVITVTTRENGYTAECLVTFIGVPTDIVFSGDFVEASDGCYYFGVGNTYNYDVYSNNVFGTVADYYQDLEITLSAYGDIVLGTYEKYKDGGDKWYDESIHSVSLDSIKENFINIEFNAGVLSVTTKKTVESYYETKEMVDGYRTTYYTNKFKEYASADAYFCITIRQPDTNLVKTVKIRFDETVVSGVETSSSQINF